MQVSYNIIFLSGNISESTVEKWIAEEKAFSEAKGETPLTGEL